MNRMDEMCDPCATYCLQTEPMCSSELKGCKSRELISSVLYTSCDCVKRNGLQHDCQREDCKGRPQCLTLPEPSCCPAKKAKKFMNMTMGARKTLQPNSNYPDMGNEAVHQPEMDCEFQLPHNYFDCCIEPQGQQQQNPQKQNISMPRYPEELNIREQMQCPQFDPCSGCPPPTF